MMDTVIWWTGACILSAGAGLVTVSAFALLVVAATWLANYYGRRAYNIQDNLRHMHKWRRAGEPKWYFKDGEMTQMRPTKTIDGETV